MEPCNNFQLPKLLQTPEKVPDSIQIKEEGHHYQPFSNDAFKTERWASQTRYPSGWKVFELWGGPGLYTFSNVLF